MDTPHGFCLSVDKFYVIRNDLCVSAPALDSLVPIRGVYRTECE